MGALLTAADRGHRMQQPDPITLIADTIEAHQDLARFLSHRVELACTCDDWRSPSDVADSLSEYRRHRAGAVVAALTQAGHMLPPDTEMTVEHGYRYRAPGKAWRVVGQMSAEEAELRVAQWYRTTVAGFEAQHVSRTVHTSPWREVSGQ